MEDDQVDEVMYLAAACNRWRHSQDPRGDDEITRLAAACHRRRWRCQRRHRSQLNPRDDGRRWSNLPKDILHEVICRLPRSVCGSRLELAVVCRHWHAAVRQLLPRSLPRLCLALPRGQFFTFQPRFLPGLKIHMNNANHASYRGATGSQLLLATDGCGVYRLENVFTGRTRLLPVPSGIRVQEDDIHELEYYYHSKEMPVRKLVACPDAGLIAAIVGNQYSAKIALFPTESVVWSSWSVVAHDPWRCYADMTFFDGKLYALTNDEELLSLEVAGYNDQSGQPRISQVIDASSSRNPLHGYTRMRYLVVRPRSRGLLMVCRIMLECGLHEFLVFQVDFRSSRWVQVDTLGGDEAIFIGRLCSKAVLADRHGVRGDQIFFLDYSSEMEGPGLSLCDGCAKVYDMKDGSISKVLSMNSHRHGAVPATWLFHEDVDVEE